MEYVRPGFQAHTVCFLFLHPLALDRSLFPYEATPPVVLAGVGSSGERSRRGGLERAPQMPRSTTSGCALADGWRINCLRVPLPGGVLAAGTERPAVMPDRLGTLLEPTGDEDVERIGAHGARRGAEAARIAWSSA